MHTSRPMRWIRKFSLSKKKKTKRVTFSEEVILPSTNDSRSTTSPRKLVSSSFFGNQWESIPADMLKEIFARIEDGPSLLACYQVNRRWNETLSCMEEQLWKNLCLNEWQIEDAHLCSVTNWKEAWMKSNKHNFNVVQIVNSEIENLKMKSSMFHHFLMLDSLKFPAIPSSLFSVQHLKRLYLNGNCITSVPEGLGKLTSLNILDLSNNFLTTLPEEMASLTSLRYVYLSKNRFQQVPEVVLAWNGVTALYLDNNLLTTIPPALGDLPFLKSLFLHNNPLNHRSCMNVLKKKRKTSLSLAV